MCELYIGYIFSLSFLFNFYLLAIGPTYKRPVSRISLKKLENWSTFQKQELVLMTDFEIFVQFIIFI